MIPAATRGLDESAMDAGVASEESVQMHLSEQPEVELQAITQDKNWFEELIDAIKEFHNDYPSINIIINNDLTSNLINDLKLGKLDFIIYNESNIKEKNLNIEKIKELKQGFIYNEKFYKDNINDFNDLNNYPLILQKKESNSRKLIDSIMSINNIVLCPRLEVVSQDLIMEFVNIGLGIGFGIIDLAKRKGYCFKELRINEKIPNIKVSLATNKSISLTYASKTFIKYLKNIL